MAKNEAITITYTAWDTAANSPKTGDVANHTIKVIADGVDSSPAASPSEVGYGEYAIELGADENTGDMMAIVGESGTDGVIIIKASWQNGDPGSLALATVIDGVTVETLLRTVLASQCGVSTPDGDTNVFCRQDGETPNHTVTYGDGDGQRTACEIHE